VGRKKKVRGKVLEGPRGKHVRVTTHLLKAQQVLARYTRKRPPRGKAADLWPLTSFLKERVPLVYVFIVDELNKSDRERNPDLQRIVEEWREVTSDHLKKSSARHKWPSARQLTPYVIERAMGDTWKTWELKRPYSQQEHDHFFRRYVHGHPKAIRDFREALRQPQPWHRHHVGHEIKWFLGRPGEAARKYNLLKPRSSYATIVSIVEED